MPLKKQIIVLVCLGDVNLNAELLELAIVSLRKIAGYSGDILVFTDFPRRLRFEDQLAITLVQVNKYPSKDPRNFRIYMDEYFDFSSYEKLVYIDFDILALKDVSRLFDFITEDVIYFTYAPVFPWENQAFMAGNYVQSYLDSDIVQGSTTGICSGVFGIKVSLLNELLTVWKGMLANTATNNDQHALNEAIVRGMINGKPYPNEWVSYPAQVRTESDDRRTFSGEKDFILYHFNPVNNQVKYRMMTEYLKKALSSPTTRPDV